MGRQKIAGVIGIVVKDVRAQIDLRLRLAEQFAHLERDAVCSEMPGLEWIRSHLTVDGKHSFCEFEAPNGVFVRALNEPTNEPIKVEIKYYVFTTVRGEQRKKFSKPRSK